MKPYMLFLLVISLFTCQQEPKNYVTLSGKILNPHESKELKVFKDKTYEKIISLKEDGTFSDTLKLEAGTYNFKHGDEYGSIYLENGFETSLETDYEDFDSQMVFKGDGSDQNNYGIQSYLLADRFFNEDLINNPSREAVEKATTAYKGAFSELKNKFKDVDSTTIANSEKQMEATVKSIDRYFASKLVLLEALPEGSPSPTFENYINYKGGTTSLSDLKGKYVYVDIWATWCGPCKREIPSLKKVEEQFHDRNIEFVSISVDDERRSGTKEKAFSSWKKMVGDKDLGGIQLFSDKAWQSDFVRAYKVTGIPRFILIDPEGNIVTPDAPRPSNPKLVELLEEKLSS